MRDIDEGLKILIHSPPQGGITSSFKRKFQHILLLLTDFLVYYCPVVITNYVLGLMQNNIKHYMEQQ